MSRKQITAGNIKNRSPWLVTVRAQPYRARQFPYPRLRDAEAYCGEMKALGLKASLTQLETAFQLRVRRAGVKQQFITFNTLVEAEQACLQIEANLSVGIVRDYAIASRNTLGDLMQRYLNEIVPTHKGGDVEAGRLRKLLRDESFVDKKLAALDTEDLQDFINDRLTEVAPATVDRELDLISQVLRYADDVWRIAPPVSPFKGLRRPKYFNERDRRLTPDEERRLLEAARNDENPYLEPAIILALETAMRRGELLSLTITDINFEQRYALLKTTKNGRSRKVPLSRQAMEVLRSLPPDEDGRLLCLTANALKIGFFRRVLAAAGIQDLTFHDLRHEAISRLAESGKFQLIELQAISGHRDMRMLQRYAHLCAGLLAAKMDDVRTKATKQYVHRGRRRTVTTRGVAPATQEPIAPANKREPQTASNVIDIFSARRAVA